MHRYVAMPVTEGRREPADQHIERAVLQVPGTVPVIGGTLTGFHSSLAVATRTTESSSCSSIQCNPISNYITTGTERHVRHIQMNIGVLGAGTMGHGIAQVNARAGHTVTIRDIEPELVEQGIEQIERNLEGAVERDKATEAERNATLARIDGTTDLDVAVSDADLVIEAAPEDMELKKSIFTDVEAAAPADAVVATNTSSLSVTELAATLEHDSRVVGLHFFNPTHILPLVEVVIAEQTDEETEAFAEEYVADLGKTAISVTDFPGFASSRLSAMFSREAIVMVQQGVVSIEDIDKTFRVGYNMPMGPIELVDHTGVDINMGVLEYLTDELGERFRPPQLLRRKYRAGKLGEKTGEGFYVWENGEIVGVSGANN
jgi:3-hydroxybutyryl-CoA dehydrogenase